ncbi:MAG TPA: hypothetical protein VMQ17_15525, partial [Candidatus Sulfotelmatobacter sp.]|nr:hypothetical protein [Candidatus Sulfotelmatobacter sp.]
IRSTRLLPPVTAVKPPTTLTRYDCLVGKQTCLREMREAMNTTPVRKMDEDIEDGDVSELDTIPELNLDLIPELDLSKVPSWTA